MGNQVLIVGCGPAGIFTALTLAESGVDRIILFDQGNELEERSRHDARNVLCGWGGAGAYSDGKLNISAEVGGYLTDFLDKADLVQLLQKTDEVFVNYGAPHRIFGDNAASVEEIADQSRLAGLEFVPTIIRHIGTENCQRVLHNMRRALLDKAEVNTRCQVTSLRAEGGRIRGVTLKDGRTVEGDFVVVAPGRVGANWIKGEVEALGLRTVVSPVDIGVRVEVPAAVLKKLPM